MKRWIHASTNVPEIGDKVTVYEGKVGYANYEGTLVDIETNKYGVEIGVVDIGRRETKVPMSQIVPSQYDYLKSLTLDEVLTKDFLSKMIHNDDSIWCDKIKYSRVDRDVNMENVVGVDALIHSYQNKNNGFRVCIINYISKHGSVTRDIEDEDGLDLDDPMIDDAIDILKQSKEVVVNFAGHQRIFRK